MEGAVTWPVLVFISGVSLALSGGSIRLVVYALNIRREIDLRIAHLATREDIEKLTKKIDDERTLNNAKYDALWNNDTTRNNELSNRVSTLEGRMNERERDRNA